MRYETDKLIPEDRRMKIPAGLVAHSYNLCTERRRLEDEGFKVIIIYLDSSRTV